MIRKLTSVLLLASFGLSTQAQTVLLEEKFSSGIPSSWTTHNLDALTPNESVSDFTQAWIGKTYGTDTSAASTSFYEPTGIANDFLVTPKVELGNFSRLVWKARSVDASFPDGYNVLISTTDSLPASFTDTLYTSLAETPFWSTRSSELDMAGYANQSIYIAFQNNSENGFVLLIDDVQFLGAETAGILSDTEKITLEVYPNPTSEILNINTSETIMALDIFSIDGQHIRHLNGNKTSIYTNTLDKGMYFIIVTTDLGQKTVSFTKN